MAVKHYRSHRARKAILDGAWRHAHPHAHADPEEHERLLVGPTGSHAHYHREPGAEPFIPDHDHDGAAPLKSAPHHGDVAGTSSDGPWDINYDEREFGKWSLTW
jgi:hypothetical protein